MGFDCRSQCRFTLSNTHHQQRHKLKFHSCLIRQAQRAGGLADVKLSLWSGLAVRPCPHGQSYTGALWLAP